MGTTYENKPKIVYRFLETVEPMIKAKTCQTMGSCLANFHHWLSRKSVSLDKLNRRHIIQWLTFLKSQGLHPSTIGYKVSTVRRYLLWLFEERIISVPTSPPLMAFSIITGVAFRILVLIFERSMILRATISIKS